MFLLIVIIIIILIITIFVLVLVIFIVVVVVAIPTEQKRFEIQVLMPNLVYTDALANPESEQYQALEDDLESQVNKSIRHKELACMLFNDRKVE